MTAGSASQHRRSRLWAAMWMASAVVLFGAALLLGGHQSWLVERSVLVHVRWRDGLSARDQQAREAQFELRRLKMVGPATWQYELTDLSRSNIETLVRNPDVADTHHIDRARFTVASDAPVISRRPGPLGRLAPGAAVWLDQRGVAALRALALASIALAAISYAFAGLPARIAAWLTRGVPVLSLDGLVVFRLALGVGVTWFVAAHASQPMPLAAQRTDVPLADFGFVHALANEGGRAWLVERIAIAALVLFTAGFWARQMLAIAVSALALWMLVLALRSGGHAFGVLLAPLAAMLTVPWNDAPPLFARSRTPRPPSARYGFAPWVLCLALGVAFAAAATSKLREGPDWILDGSVKYAFVADAAAAHVNWGLRIATHPALAVLLSAGAVLTEALVIVAAFTRRARLRLALGIAAAVLLSGFVLLQGVFWPAWWLLLLGFVPWDRVVRRSTIAAASPARPLTWPQTAAVLALIGQQIVVTAAAIEIEPFASRYDMYSTTHASPEAFDEANPEVHRRVIAIDRDGTTMDITECAGDRNRTVEQALEAPTVGGDWTSFADLRACAGTTAPARYELLEDRRAFDWTAGRFYWQYRDRIVASAAAPD